MAQSPSISAAYPSYVVVYIRTLLDVFIRSITFVYPLQE